MGVFGRPEELRFSPLIPLLPKRYCLLNRLGPIEKFLADTKNGSQPCPGAKLSRLSLSRKTL
jgi:hypothetical protein